nr:fibroblast growth factor receptor-like isoform X2 [Ciona intestinalis]|eukprot:XP_018672743.1 fibroblast growth factor receptor-like isoform X2 [Ciona intestinalis]
MVRKMTPLQNMLIFIALIILTMASTAQTNILNPRAPYWVHERKMQKRLYTQRPGSTVRFRCAVLGTHPITIDWYKDGKLMKKRGRVGGYKFRQRHQQITLESVVMSDRAKYMCVAHNKYGSINHIFEMDVVDTVKPIPSQDTQSNQFHPAQAMN